MPQVRRPSARAGRSPPAADRGRAERNEPARRGSRLPRAVRAAARSASDPSRFLVSGATARAAPRTWASSSSIALPAIAITAITVLAAALRLYDLASVPGNPFYDAAVRSMGLSWHNF